MQFIQKSMNENSENITVDVDEITKMKDPLNLPKGRL